MGKQSQKIKCLFGHHMFDESLTLNAQYSPMIQEIFTICSICRKVGRIWSIFPENVSTVKIIKEDSEKFVVKIDDRPHENIILKEGGKLLINFR